jgi:hypothetical protein
MTDRENGVWRDEERLPLSELSNAMATSSLDGQLDDVTGNDAGYEDEFGHGPRAEERPEPGDTDPYRADRPSTTGRNGPH